MLRNIEYRGFMDIRSLEYISTSACLLAYNFAKTSTLCLCAFTVIVDSNSAALRGIEHSPVRGVDNRSVKENYR